LPANLEESAARKRGGPSVDSMTEPESHADASAPSLESAETACAESGIRCAAKIAVDDDAKQRATPINGKSVRKS
jgi:hypothetical protein